MFSYLGDESFCTRTAQRCCAIHNHQRLIIRSKGHIFITFVLFRVYPTQSKLKQYVLFEGGHIVRFEHRHPSTEIFWVV